MTTALWPEGRSQDTEAQETVDGGGAGGERVLEWGLGALVSNT